MTEYAKWIKELKSWIANSKAHKKYCERQVKFWQGMLASGIKQLELEEKWLEEAIAEHRVS